MSRLASIRRLASFDSATGFAIDRDWLTLVAFRPIGEHQGIAGKWRFEREAWAAPGTPNRMESWEMAFDTEGHVGLVERYESDPRALDLGTWHPGARDNSFILSVAAEDQEYLLLGEVLTPANALFRRD